MTTHHEEFRFGSAQWATSREIARAGLHIPHGPFLGFLGQRPLRLANDSPLITFGGAGSGKLRDCLAYNLCGIRDGKGSWHAPRRMLVNDPRGELSAISISNQLSLGKAAYCINPFGLHGLPRHRVNPWNILRQDSPTFHADVKLLVSDLITLPARGDDYFGRRARELSEALIKTHIAGAGSSKTRDAISLSTFYDLVNMMAIPSGWDTLVTRMMAMPDGDIHRVAEEMSSKRKEAPKEYGAIVGSLYESIQALSDPAIRDTLSGSDFSLEILCQQDCNIYIVIPAEYLGLLAPVQRAIFGTAILYKNRHPAAPGVLLVVDEAAQLGNFEALIRAYSYGRGMGLRTWSFWQDPGQITRNYGEAALSGFIGSSQCRQFFGVRDLETARLASNMLGQQTLEYDAVLEQGMARIRAKHAVQNILAGGDPFTTGFELAQHTRAASHRTKQARALMTPDEVLNMPEDRQILFISGFGLAPVRAHKRPYFTRPEMAGGYLPNPYHKPYDRVHIAGRWSRRWAKVIRERVPASLAHWPQHQSGEWAYVEGHRPV
ncbi:type IV secretory system conjugative DNA transfer family protein [Allopusillimonas ginsengisoli]|uniref:type IV secretory system conjugative DNA transfer family protein n=1 Tax=Allopusillimonas ginsengisoli TaxID=453575 RepID=UPI00142FC818|nr:type IV secretory system conjugative DNA transfer family protein [Allopusillimonas ginsengisoli]